MNHITIDEVTYHQDALLPLQGYDCNEIAQQAHPALVHYARADLIATLRGFQTRWLDPR